MRITELDLKGAFLLEPEVYQDRRGLFVELYHAMKCKGMGKGIRFVQQNFSRSIHGTVRGLHGQLRRPQGKFVRVLDGDIYDVMVDARPGSKTFGQWRGIPLTGAVFRQVFIPAGCLHGFCVTSPTADVEYLCTGYYDPSDEVGVVWNDPDLKIAWPIQEPILSPKDAAFPKFRELKGKFKAFYENKR